jgi:hypothetical protein
MDFKDDNQFRMALDLIKIGLQSGTIKLNGVGRSDSAVANGTADAAYLIALLQGLSQALPR